MSDAEIEDILKKGDIDKDGYWSHNYALHPINSFMNTQCVSKFNFTLAAL